NSREKEDLSALKNNSQALKQMLDNSQFYFEIQKNSQQLRKEKFELREIIEQVINFFDFYISEQELKIKNLIEENKYIIKTDRSHFMHAVFNILSELKEFSSKAEIVFTAAESASELKLNISLQSADAVFMQLKNVEEQQTGDFKAENIFEYRQQKTAEIFSKLGGELDFRKEDKNHFQISLSFPGRMYTDFYLEKVNYRKERTQFSKTAESENKKEGENIKAETEKLKIIVYSSQQRDNLRILEDFLLLQDYRLKKVRTKSELTAEIDKKTVLLIFDIFSLGEEELGYCREIRERFTLFQLPILIIASRSLPENMIRSFEIGINDFIKKPFEISELKSRIRTLISLKEKVEESFRQEQNYLRAQIKPHFLYNTLDTIAYLCQSDPELAGELIIDLANYLRYSFDFDNLDQLVSINKELDLVKFYVSIQQQRFKNKFRVEYQLEDNLDFKVPPLVLQSLVENSVKHGFSEMKEGGLIKISVQEKENFYLIEVSDNGIGISKEKIADIFSEKTRKEENRRQIGLKNINRRLKRLFDQKLEVENGLKQGTVVKVRIPKNQAVE
ncbi:MAG: histidine kinase, partial [bacterium]